MSGSRVTTNESPSCASHSPTLNPSGRAMSNLWTSVHVTVRSSTCASALPTHDIGPYENGLKAPISCLTVGEEANSEDGNHRSGTKDSGSVK